MADNDYLVMPLIQDQCAYFFLALMQDDIHLYQKVIKINNSFIETVYLISHFDPLKLISVATNESDFKPKSIGIYIYILINIF